MMKNKIITSALAFLMVISTSVTAFAGTQPTNKDEVIYAMADAEGNIKGVYAVNSFTSANIIDYGTYSSVKNLSSEDKINVSGDKISIKSSVDKLYYQGNIDNKNIPWTVSVKYYLNGSEYTSDKIAGKNGSLKIKIKINRNDDCDDTFYKGYCLQISLSLDSEKCTNIVSDGATTANVGSKKQLSYIVMPDKGADIEIDAEVKDFEMDGISINALKMNLSPDMDSDALNEQIDKIKSAATELDDGAKKVSDGSKSVQSGTKKLSDGTKKINSGTDSLNDGIESLSAGVKTAQEALTSLDENSAAVTDGSSEVLNALNQIDTSLKQIKIDTENIQKLTEASAQIKGGIDSLVAGLQKMDGGITEYYSALNKAGITDTSTFIAQHKQAIAALGITDTQRELYSAYTENGVSGVQQKLEVLATRGDKEAMELYQAYTTTGDSSVITDYVTSAGKLISVETLLKADIGYIQGSDKLISSFDSQLDSNDGELMTGALALQKNYASFDASINTLADSLQSMASDMLTLKTAISVLAEKYSSFDSGINGYTEGVAKILNGYDTLYDGAVRSAQGSAKLCTSTNTLVQSTLKLYGGTKDLTAGTSELKNGTEKFKSKTNNIDKTVEDKINETADDITGKNVEVKSFVSEKNKNINSVLFIIKTDSIKTPGKEVQEEIKANQTFWQKLLALFKK